MQSKRTSNHLSANNLLKFPEQNNEKGISSSGLNVTFRDENAIQLANNNPHSQNNLADSSLFNLPKMPRKNESKTDSRVALITKVYNNGAHNRLQNSNESLISANQLARIDVDSESTLN